ncbi:uncharacterized protein HD556DRAFT_1443083 [Suillus plorans]|uniref:Uncharacterized protein n=1 Tax=Suillus plorans TaxID=116603 RepID=A0A9P7AQA5_9AGAM|nr:uncharacterized protein HD556DRAFT_1443083 [Suillus plorans]KAG1794123.1 hypothetical protein HD556DRAFT_1443083 [Suillus plorans]
MDAQRFDPLRHTNMISISFGFITLRFLTLFLVILQRLASLFKTRTSDSTPMRPGPCVKSEKTSASDVRLDHKIVVDPVEGKDPDLKGSCPSPKDTCTTRVTTPVDVHDSIDKVATHTITRSEPNPHGGAPILSVTEIVFRRPPSRTNTSSPSPSQSSPSVSPRSIPPPGFNDSVDKVATGTIIHFDPHRGIVALISHKHLLSLSILFAICVIMVFRGVLSRSPSCTQMVFTGMVLCLPACTNTSSPSRSSSPSASSQSTPPPGFIRQVFRALNRFNTSSACDSDVDDLKVHRRKRHTLLAIVKERREKHKDDQVFKDIAGNDFPAAGVRDST